MGQHGHPLLVAGLYTCRVTRCLSPRVPNVTRHRSHAADLNIPLVSGLWTLMAQCTEQYCKLKARLVSVTKAGQGTCVKHTERPLAWQPVLRYCLLANLQNVLPKKPTTRIQREAVGRIIEAVSPLGLAVLVANMP